MSGFDPSTNKPSSTEQPSLRCDILEAVVLYFQNTGCAAAIDERRSLVVVSAPYSRDQWWIDFPDHQSEYLVIVPKGFYVGEKGLKKKTIQVPLSDPDSLPKLLKFIKEKSTYLRGGLSDERWEAQDVE